MNEKFRNAFLSAFGCGPQGRGFGRAPNRSTDLLSASFNDSFNLKTRLRLNVAGKRFEVCFFLLFFLKIHENS